MEVSFDRAGAEEVQPEEVDDVINARHSQDNAKYGDGFEDVDVDRYVHTWRLRSDGAAFVDGRGSTREPAGIFEHRKRGFESQKR